MKTLDSYPCSWTLPRGVAITLRAGAVGSLRVSHGHVWVTVQCGLLDVPGSGAGDLFLLPADTLAVRKGWRMVLEAWPLEGSESVHVLWEPVLQSSPATAWQKEVAQPAAEIFHSLCLLLRACGRLLAGCWGYSRCLQSRDSVQDAYSSLR